MAFVRDTQSNTPPRHKTALAAHTERSVAYISNNDLLMSSSGSFGNGRRHVVDVQVGVKHLAELDADKRDADEESDVRQLGLNRRFAQIVHNGNLTLVFLVFVLVTVHGDKAKFASVGVVRDDRFFLLL